MKPRILTGKKNVVDRDVLIRNVCIEIEPIESE